MSDKSKVRCGLIAMKYYVEGGSRLLFVQVPSYDPRGDGIFEVDEIAAVLEYIEELQAGIPEGDLSAPDISIDD